MLSMVLYPMLSWGIFLQFSCPMLAWKAWKYHHENHGILFQLHALWFSRESMDFSHEFSMVFFMDFRRFQYQGGKSFNYGKTDSYSKKIAPQSTIIFHSKFLHHSQFSDKNGICTVFLGIRTKCPPDKTPRTKSPGQNPPRTKSPWTNPPSIFYILLTVIYCINCSK